MSESYEIDFSVIPADKVAEINSKYDLDNRDNNYTERLEQALQELQRYYRQHTQSEEATTKPTIVINSYKDIDKLSNYLNEIDQRERTPVSKKAAKQTGESQKLEKSDETVSSFVEKVEKKIEEQPAAKYRVILDCIDNPFVLTINYDEVVVGKTFIVLVAKNKRNSDIIIKSGYKFILHIDGIGAYTVNSIGIDFSLDNYTFCVLLIDNKLKSEGELDE